jgi:hypothetical protein
MSDLEPDWGGCLLIVLLVLGIVAAVLLARGLT